MKYVKKDLLSISEKIYLGKKISPQEIQTILTFEQVDKDPKIITLLKNLAIPLALIVGFIISVFPSEVDIFVKHLPSWTNFPDSLLGGVDYLWDFIGEPVHKNNIVYHLPNIILYSFGVVGVKKIFDALNRRNWVDKVHTAKLTLEEQIRNGTLSVVLKKGHSVLFLGKGDFIGMQFILNQKPNNVVAIAEVKPEYTNIWNYYNTETSYEDLKSVLERISNDETGEYVFFPVKDDQIFLPDSSAYDLSPHKLDIVCQDIRMIEKKHKWKNKRILIIGDKYHRSYVHSEDKKGKINKTEDTISMQTIAKKYANITLLDPTDIVLSHIINIAKGRKIVFRATKEGIKAYKSRFYKRIEELGYKQTKKKGILTIGYDLFEDQTEQQTLSHKIDDYYPVVLSKNVRDALIRNGYKKSEFIYVPDLVLDTLYKKAAEQ